MEETFQTWGRLFGRHPHWQSVASELEQGGDDVSVAAAAVPFAHLARCVADATKWAPLDGAYWAALLADPPTISVDPSPTPAGVLSLAKLLLAPYFPYAMPVSPLRIEQGLRWCQIEHPQLDWKLLHDEAQRASRLPTLPFSRTFRKTLLAAARVNHRCQDAAASESLLACALANTDRSLLAGAARLILGVVGGSFALWLGDESGSGAWTDAAESLQFSDARSRTAFELQLPGTLRHSIDFGEPRTGACGTLYLERGGGSRPDLTRRLERLGSVLKSRNAMRAKTSTDSPRPDELDRIKSRLRAAIKEFSAGAAHTIHNPLATIAGKAQKLLAAEQHPERRDDLHKILHQVSRIHEMIRDLHLVGRGSFGRNHTADLSEVVASALSQIGSAGVDLRVGALPEHVVVRGDGDDLSRAVLEIIRNAVEAAGQAGTVQVECSLEPVGWATLKVRDSGRGFSADDLHHAFDPFYSGKSAGRGMGMGLTVAQSIVEHFGGSVSIHPTTPTTVEILLRLA